jgi:hypothetical protein
MSALLSRNIHAIKKAGSDKYFAYYFLFPFPPKVKIFFFISASLRLFLCHGYATLFRLFAPFPMKVLKKNFCVGRKEVINDEFNGLSLGFGSRCLLCGCNDY